MSSNFKLYWVWVSKKIPNQCSKAFQLFAFEPLWLLLKKWREILPKKNNYKKVIPSVSCSNFEYLCIKIFAKLKGNCMHFLSKVSCQHLKNILRKNSRKSASILWIFIFCQINTFCLTPYRNLNIRKFFTTLTHHYNHLSLQILLLHGAVLQKNANNCL